MGAEPAAPDTRWRSHLRVDEWVRIESSMCVARWFGVLFAVFQVSVFSVPDAPAHVRPVGYALAGLLAVTNLAVRSAVARVDTLGGARRLAWSTLLLDAAGVSGFVWLYAFDPTSSLYLLLFILPAEAALKFQATGAIVAWAACTTTYVLRELWASDVYGAELEVTSITFRMGVLLIVSLLIAMFARKLADRSSELGDALTELEHQDQWRQALIDMLAHDLRSPVATATSTLLLIRDRIEHLSPDDVRGLTTAAVGQNQRALRLTEDLLDLARSQQGRLEMQCEDVPIGPLLHRVLATVPLAPGDVRVAIDDGLVAWVDPGRIEQVLANLLTNAAKHGSPPVEVAARSVAGDLELRVTDHGAGVAGGALGTLFAPFAEGADAGSVGLGLWIVHTLTAAHGGTVAYHPDAGRASFVVRIPGAARPSSAPSGVVPTS